MLGPLLFLLYVNDIHQCSNNLKFYLFADDTNTLYADKNLKSLENIVNIELQNLHEWLTSNKLTLNTTETNFIKKKVTYQPSLYMFDNETNGNVTLESKNYIKYLGVLIDKNLTWKYHIDAITAKISKTVGLISKLRHSIPRHILLYIYQTLIHPHLNYGLAAWGQASKTSLNKILILQKKVLRMMYFTDIREHAIPLFIDADILPVSFMYYKTVANLMHDINNNNSPTNLLNLFEKNSTIHSYYTRSSRSGNFHVKSSKLQIHKNSLSRFGVTLWNEMPCHIRDLPKKKFRKVLHRLLLDILKREDDFIETPLIVEKVRLIV